MHSVFLFADKALSFSWRFQMGMNSSSFSVAARETTNSAIFVSEDITKVTVEFRLNAFSHEVADVINLRNFALFPDLGCHILPIFDEVVWQTSYDLEKVLICVDVGKIVDLSKGYQAINHI